MPEGFFVTNKGIELIKQAVIEEKKVEINKAQFGDGGNIEAEFNYDITALTSKQYEKSFDPLTDSYETSPTDPKALMIKVVVPAEVACTINEVGFLDKEDNLIIYGYVRERVKESGIKFQYESWVKFDNVDESAVEIVIVSPEYEKVEELVESTKADFDERIQRIENEFNLDNYITEAKLNEKFKSIQVVEDSDIDAWFTE